MKPFPAGVWGQLKRPRTSSHSALVLSPSPGGRRRNSRHRCTPLNRRKPISSAGRRCVKCVQTHVCAAGAGTRRISGISALCRRPQPRPGGAAAGTGAGQGSATPVHRPPCLCLPRASLHPWAPAAGLLLGSLTSRDYKKIHVFTYRFRHIHTSLPPQRGKSQSLGHASTRAEWSCRCNKLSR